MEFHKAHLTEHLWPRSEQEFQTLAKSECLMEIVELKAPGFLQWLIGNHCEEIVGLAYVMNGTEPGTTTKRAEFGGIFVSEDARGLGLAVSLGIVSISNYFVQDPPLGRMIAHVHEFNEKPRSRGRSPGVSRRACSEPGRCAAGILLATPAIGVAST